MERWGPAAPADSGFRSAAPGPEKASGLALDRTKPGVQAASWVW